MAAKEKRVTDTIKVQEGCQLTTVGSPFFRDWASKSQTKGYIFCIWCNSEFLAKNAGGKNGHESSDRHKKFAEQYMNKVEQTKVKTNKEREFLTRFQENQEKTKLFEYKFLSLCLGIS